MHISLSFLSLTPLLRHPYGGNRFLQSLYIIMFSRSVWFTSGAPAPMPNLVENVVFAISNLVETAVFAILNLVV